MCLTVYSRPGLPASTGFPLDPGDPNVDCRRIRMLLIGVNEPAFGLHAAARSPALLMVSNVRGECRGEVRGWGIRSEVGGAGKEGRKRREGTRREASGVGLEGRRDFPP